jgi:hypothetical protein
VTGQGDGWVSLGELLKQEAAETAAQVMPGREERLAVSSDDVRSRSQQERRAAESLTDREQRPEEDER